MSLHQLVDDMIETMYAAPGIGLAAPQVGVSLRVCVIDLSVGKASGELFTIVNPEFVSREGMQLEDEGCLSLPGFTATVPRPSKPWCAGWIASASLSRYGAKACSPGRSSTKSITSTACVPRSGPRAQARGSSSARSASSHARENGDAAPGGFLRHARVRGAHARGAPSLVAYLVARRHPARSPARPRAEADAGRREDARAPARRTGAAAGASQG